ncbi:acyltransferase family protein [Agromyces soli]|uniref:Acyltransferase n=1 Tax=Agromyces soli TaxID=659012 RepID=A0ABY4ASN5_9MICO|nr:acyltransferase family protein [Agromyces soli]UOE26015.1 acyltransferase [Agromyces soli]
MTRSATMNTPGEAAVRPVRSGFRADIQGLRAFAVVVVVLDHLFRWPSGGFIGVDVFFVISGYLITSHILRELERTERLSLSGFYRRRIRRIAPAATVVILVTVAVSALILPRSRAVSVAIDGIWAFFFGANWRSMSVGTDYFQLGQLPSPLQHYWSLSVEEQFYFVWPLLTMIVFLVALRRWGGATSARRAVVATYAVLVVASFVWAVVETAQNPTVAYFSTFSRAWELGVGALLAAVLTRSLTIPFGWRITLAWAGLAGLVASVFLIDSASVFPAPTVALPVLATVAVIAAGVGSSAEPRYDRALWPLTNRISTYVGAISYSVYLWHFPVIVLLVSFVPQGSRRYFALALALTAVLSVLSYHFVEEPVRRSNWLLPGSPPRRQRRSRLQVAATAVGITALVVAMGLGAVRLAMPGDARTTADASASCFGAAAAPGAGNACEENRAGGLADVAPSLDDLAEDTAGGYSCWRPEGGELKTCTFGSEAADALKVALVGDSHAAALLPALLGEAEGLGWSLDTYTGYGCQWRDQPEVSDCDRVADEVQDRLVSGGYDLIITTAARWATEDAPPESFSSRWEAAEAAGAAVVVVAAAPTVPESVLACLTRVGATPEECATPRTDALQPDDVELVAARDAGADVVDMTDFYCTDEVCPAVIGGVIVARDAAGHITGTYMKSMAPFLIERIRAAAGI